MRETEDQLIRNIEEISGRSVTLNDHPMELLDSLGVQELLARYRLKDTQFPSLADLRTVRSLAEFLAVSGSEDI
jgi:hypothetical protein